MQAAEKKRPKEEREFLHRLRPFARLQTAEDYEAFATDILCTFTREFLYFFSLSLSPFRRSAASEENTRIANIPTSRPVNIIRH